LGKIRKIELFSDGASWGNPGKAGIGVIIYDENKKIIKRFGKFIGEATNNTAEYMALIYGLQEALILGAKELIINLDSELIARQLEGLYRVKDANLKVLFEQASHLLQGFKKIEIKNIERTRNKEADRLATQAIKEAVKKKLPVTKVGAEKISTAMPRQRELF